MGDEDFLAAVEADNLNAPVEEPTETPPAEPAAEQPKEPEPAERPRDEHGKFKAKEPEAPPEPQAPEPVMPEPPAPEAQHAPITALLDEREKRQKAEALAQQREAELERLRAAQQPAEIPDPDRDPVGFANYQQGEVQKLLLNERLNTSERFARKEYGAEAVEAAKEWAKAKFSSDPHYVQSVYGDADPYEKLVTDHRREQFFSQVSDPSEIEEFRAWKAAKGQLAQQAGQPAPPNPAPAIPAPSLASAPSAGGILTEVEQTDEDIFAEVMPKG